MSTIDEPLRKVAIRRIKTGQPAGAAFGGQVFRDIVSTSVPPRCFFSWQWCIALLTFAFSFNAKCPEDRSGLLLVLRDLLEGGGAYQAVEILDLLGKALAKPTAPRHVLSVL